MVSDRNHCDYDLEYVLNIENHEMWFAWYIVAPVHFILGTPGHVLLLAAFYKQYKEENAYMYQVFATVSEFLELQFWTILVVTVHFLSGAEGNEIGVEWYRKSYISMWYAAHLAHTNFSTFFTCSLLLSVAMTADRVFAMTYPFKYKQINHRRHQILALIACLIISASTGFPDGLRYSVIRDGDRYKIWADENNVSSWFAKFVGHARNIVRILALIALIALNLIMIRTFRCKFKQIGAWMPNDAKEKKRKAQERTLLMLTICQSSFQAVSVLSSVIYFSLMFSSSYFAMCIWGIYGPLMDIMIEACDLLDLYFTVVINRQFRKNVLSMFPCYKNRDPVTNTNN